MKKILIIILVFIVASCAQQQNGKKQEPKKISKIDELTSKFHFALRKNDFKLAKSILEQGADINSVDKYGETRLHNAIKYRKYKIFMFLIKNGIDLSHIDKNGNNYLFYAANLIHDDGSGYDKADTKFIKILLDNHDFDLNHENKHGFTALDQAINPPQYKIVRLLMKRGAKLNVNKIYSLNNKTKLHFLMNVFMTRYYDPDAGEEAMKIAEILLKNGADQTLKCDHFSEKKSALEIILPLKEAYNFNYRKQFKKDVLRMEALLRKYAKKQKGGR